MSPSPALVNRKRSLLVWLMVRATRTRAGGFPDRSSEDAGSKEFQDAAFATSHAAVIVRVRREQREGAVHAVVGQVKVDTSREEEARKLLDGMVLPTSKAMAGFQGGYWARALGSDSGHSLLLFDSEENARAAAARMAEGPPPGAPTTLVSATVCEVVAQA
jgi:hypothetical protein